MKTKLGAVTAFISERPEHSSYNIRTLVEALSGAKDLTTLVVSNGCEVSEDTRGFIRSRPNTVFKELPENIGVPAAWNMGLELIDCDYLFVLNDDLWLDGVCLDEIVKVFKEAPDTAVAGVEGVVCSTLDGRGFPVTGVKYKKKKKGLFKRSAPRGVVEVSAVSGFLFAISMEFVRKTGFRFDLRYSPAFCEEFDLAYTARSRGYKTRLALGLEKHYDHAFGISSGPREIRFQGKSIMSDELSERNMRLFSEKWGEDTARLMAP